MIEFMVGLAMFLLLLAALGGIADAMDDDAADARRRNHVR